MSRGRLLLQLWAVVVFGLAVRALATGMLRSARPPDALTLRPASIDLNRASLGELQVLPGVGPVRAEAIVLDRVRHGWFRSLEDLGRVDGLGTTTLESLRPFVRWSSPGGRPEDR